MKKVLITYGDSKYEMAKTRFVQQADALKIFDKIIAYSDQDLSEELRNLTVSKYSHCHPSRLFTSFKIGSIGVAVSPWESVEVIV